jgi:hypothetical protein
LPALANPGFARVRAAMFMAQYAIDRKHFALVATHLIASFGGG